MKKRWLIRSFFIALVVVCVGAWVGSYWQRGDVAWGSLHRAYGLWAECGTIQLYSFEPRELHLDGWAWGHDSVNRRSIEAEYRAVPHHVLGFAYGPNPTLFPEWQIWVPLWFPTLLSILLLWLLWRKTRPNMAGRAFPIEPAAKSGESKP